jgi:DNA invertase Pin-like site-specific DNA recombinase
MTHKPVVHGYLRETVTGAADTERQDAALQHYARQNLPGLEYAGLWLDEADEYRFPLRSRRLGMGMCVNAERGDHIVILRFAHAFGSPRECAEQLDVLAARGVLVHVVDLGLSPQTPEGRAVGAALRALADAERCTHKERGAADFARRRMRGLPLNGTPGYGFRLVGPKGKRRPVPDPYARAVGAKIVEWKLKGWTFEAIYWHLRKHQVTRRGGRAWSLTGIRRAFEGERALQAREAAEGLVQAEAAGVGAEEAS